MNAELLAHNMYEQLISATFWENRHENTPDDEEEILLELLDDQLEPITMRIHNLIEYHRRRYQLESKFLTLDQLDKTKIYNAVESFIEKMKTTVRAMLRKPFQRFLKSYRREATLKSREEIDITNVPESFIAIIAACWHNLQAYLLQCSQHIGDDIQRLYNVNIRHTDPEDVPHSYLFISAMHFVDSDIIPYEEADALRAKIYDFAGMQIQYASFVVTESIADRNIPHVNDLIGHVDSLSNTALETLEQLNNDIVSKLKHHNTAAAIQALLDDFLQAINGIADKCIVEIVKIFVFCQRDDIYHIHILNNRRFDHVADRDQKRQGRRKFQPTGSNLRSIIP